MRVDLRFHAKQRLAGRLANVTSESSILRAVQGAARWIPVRDRETWVLVADLPRKIVLDDTSNDGTRVNGNQVWAVCFRAANNAPVRVVSIVVRDSCQPRQAGKTYIE